jgi:MoaA/NifB/PqqE/SkfB family radical SAM enzyme
MNDSLIKSIRIRREIGAMVRRLREWRMIAWALLSRNHPVDAHLIPVRRCNLSCTYCSEFDDFSKPVPTAEVLRRVDLLADLGTSIITISGGEPLLHPDLDLIVRRVRQRGLLAGLITNGYLLVPERIERLNRAGLDHLQISIDNVMPDEVSKKSLKVLDKKLQMLAQYAEFHVNINSVLGSPVRNPQDALVVARRALELGLTSTVGILHDASGQLQPLSAEQRGIFEQIMSYGKGSYARLNRFQHDIAQGREHGWRCRAGSRYLYVCENGLVHYCSQQRGYPAIPLEKYTRAHLKYEYHTRKGCAPRCTVSCVQQVAMLDNWRAPQKLEGFVPLGSLAIPSPKAPAPDAIEARKGMMNYE